MVLADVVIAVLVVALAVVTTTACWIGFLAVLGEVSLSRCERCGHLALGSAVGPIRTCSFCRHPHLLHPVHVVHHVGDGRQRRR